MNSGFEGQKVCVLGLGYVGLPLAVEFAKRHRVIGLDIDTSKIEELRKNYDRMREVTTEELAGVHIDYTTDPARMREADYITLHIPKTPETTHLINAETLATMKPTVRIVNCARGGIIDEAAIAAAINEGRIGGAALDVFENEPLEEDSVLRAVGKDLVLTPHLGASTAEAQVNVAIDVAEQIRDVLLGLPARSAVNIPGLYPDVLEKLRRSEPLTTKEQAIHERGLISVLRKIHDDLDAAVFDAYGWPASSTDEQIIERVMALNAERAAEERSGLVRWLRPDFQHPGGEAPEVQVEIAATAAAPKGRKAAAPKWPAKLPEQIRAIRSLVATSHEAWTVESAAKHFKGARRESVEGVLEGLAALGFLVSYEIDGVRRWRVPGQLGGQK